MSNSWDAHPFSGGFLKWGPKCHHGFHYEKEVKYWTISGYLHDLENLQALWIQTLSEKVLNPPNYSKLYPKHFLRRYLDPMESSNSPFHIDSQIRSGTRQPGRWRHPVTPSGSSAKRKQVVSS